MRSLIALLLLGHAAHAEKAMDAAAFQSHTLGRIFAFAYEGEPPYGTEHYLPNRQVIWIERDGSCHSGKWFQSGQNICFRYRNIAGMTCSEFYPDGDHMIVFPADDIAAHRAALTDIMLPTSCEVPLS